MTETKNKVVVISMAKSNKELFEEYKKTNDNEESKVIQGKLLKQNRGLIFKAISEVAWKKYNLLEKADVENIGYLCFLEIIKKTKEQKEEYPRYMKDLLKNQIKKTISDKYNSGGIFVPYSTISTWYINGTAEYDPFKKNSIEQSMENSEDGGNRYESRLGSTSSAEDMVLGDVYVISELKKILDKSNLEDLSKEIFLEKVFSKEKITFEKIGKSYAITEGGARYHFNKVRCYLAQNKEVKELCYA